MQISLSNNISVEVVVVVVTIVHVMEKGLHHLLLWW
jgi:hypothetical protein